LRRYRHDFSSWYNVRRPYGLPVLVGGGRVLLRIALTKEIKWVSSRAFTEVIVRSVFAERV